jgi:hypothetical protein
LEQCIQLERAGESSSRQIIQTIAAPIVGGKPDNARGGGNDVSKLDEALAKAASLLS